MIHFIKCTAILLAMMSSLVGNSTQTYASEGLKKGLYMGFVYWPEDINEEPGFNGQEAPSEPVKIPLILETDQIDTAAGNSKLLAFLKMRFGGFSSNEYLVFDYEVDDYIWEAPIVSLDTPENFVSLFHDPANGARNIFENGNVIKGKIRVGRGRRSEGIFELVYYEVGNPSSSERLWKIFPNLKVQSAITGEYVGSCKNSRQITHFQIEAIKRKKASSDPIQPLAGYQVQARAARVGEGGILETLVSEARLKYNPFLRRISLPGLSKACTLTGDHLDCGHECSFNRQPASETSIHSLLVSMECQRVDREHHIPGILEAPQLERPRSDQVHGYYFGSIHFEERNIYKAMSMHVGLVGRPNENRPEFSQDILSISSDLYLKAKQRGEDTSLSLRFNKAPYPYEEWRPIYFRGHFIEDHIYKIETWSNVGIKGTFYSKSYGRVGTFELQRNPVSEDILPSGAPEGMGILNSLSMRYEKQHISLSLRGIEFVPRFPSSFPYRLAGGAVISTTEKNRYFEFPVEFSETAYDIYTGNIFLQTPEGDFFYGRVAEQNWKIFWSGGMEYTTRYHLQNFVEGRASHSRN